MTITERRYDLTLTEAQARVLVSSLDLYMRIGLGQFREVLDVHDGECRLLDGVRDRVRALLDQIGAEIGFARGASHGICSPQVADRFRAAYDVLQVVRHRLAFDRKLDGGPGDGVDFDAPRTLSKLGLPTIKKIES